MLYAGTGKFSNSHLGGYSLGVLKSTNGGSTWSLVGAHEFSGLSITAVVATGLTTTEGEIVLASALSKMSDDGTLEKEGGVFRSTDGGLTWEQVHSGSVSDLIADPGDPRRFYAALPAAGVFRSTAATDDAAGETWTEANGISWPASISPMPRRIRLAVHDSPGYNHLYAGVVVDGRIDSALPLRESGGAWIGLDLPVTTHTEVSGRDLNKDGDTSDTLELRHQSGRPGRKEFLHRGGPHHAVCALRGR